MSLPDYITGIKKHVLENGVHNYPDAVVILGSGLGGFGDQITDSVTIPYCSIPGFPPTTVEGHSGELISGIVSGKTVLAFSGRFHHYEGHPFSHTALPVYVSKALNAGKLIVSNAAGAINTRFRVGDLMIIDSVIRLNHLSSPFNSSGFHFNLEPYAYQVRELAAATGILTRQGSYLFVKGPNYETKAEIRAFRMMGADAVGMSTVPELTEASRLKIKTAAISLITNMAAGITADKLNHEDVKQAADLRKEDFAKLIGKLIKNL